MTQQFLQTFRNYKSTYPAFIFKDNGKKNHISVLLNLKELTLLHYNNRALTHVYADQNNSISREYDVDWTFECYKMRKSILFNKPYFPNEYVKPKLTVTANTVFLLAIIYGRKDIVEYFLENGIINVNSSIFGSKFWPSYFLMACSSTQEILDLFKKKRIQNNIGWSGLTPSIIVSCNGLKLDKNNYLEFVPYSLYSMLFKYKNITLVPSEPLPLFPLDFACMTKNRNLIKDVLDSTPEAGTLSKISFIVQNEDSLILVLSRYDYNIEQKFRSNTPLHYACYFDDLVSVLMLLYLDFPIIRNNCLKFPNELGSPKTTERCSIFFNLCTTSLEGSDAQMKRVFLHKTFNEKITDLIKILDFSPKILDNYVGIFKYLKFNKERKSQSTNKFNLFGMFSMLRLSPTAEQSIKNLDLIRFKPKEYEITELNQTK